MRLDFDDVRQLDIRRIQWIYGGRFDTWINSIKSVGTIIEKQGLQPLNAEFLADDPVPVMPVMAMQKSEFVERAIKPTAFPGGIRIPHFHYKGDIFTPNEEQWQEFTTVTLDSIKAKLDTANKLNFDQLMDLSEAANRL